MPNCGGLVAGTTRVPAHSITTVRVSGAQRRVLVAEPCHHPLPPGLMLVPVLVGGDRSLYHVRVANLTDEDIVLQGRTPVATLHAVDSVDSDIIVHVASQSLHADVQEPMPLTHPDLSAKLQNFQGTAQEKRQLLDRLLRYPKASHATTWTSATQTASFTACGPPTTTQRPRHTAPSCPETSVRSSHTYKTS